MSTPKPRRGRPRIHPISTAPKRKRGRPRGSVIPYMHHRTKFSTTLTNASMAALRVWRDMIAQQSTIKITHGEIVDLLIADAQLQGTGPVAMIRRLQSNHGHNRTVRKLLELEYLAMATRIEEPLLSPTERESLIA